MGIQPIAVPRRSASYFTHLALATVLAGLIASGYVASSMASNAAAHWTHPIRSAPVVTPADYGLSFEDVELMTEDGLRLAAWYVPARNGATLLMLHGLHGNRAGDLALGSDLAERGYGLLLPDLRGHGDSEGEVSTLGFHEVRDVRAALAFLRERPEVDQTRIGVYGASLGAATAIMAAAQLPELQAVVADSSYASVEWLVEHQFNNVVALPTWLAPLVIYLGGQQIGIDAHEIAPIRYVG